MKYLKTFNERISSINESVAEEYLEELYHKGAISSDVYEITKDEEDLSVFKGTDNEIKKKLLKHLNYVGGISSDVYQMELEELEYEGMNEGLDDHFREVRVNSYLKIARDKYKGKSADEIIDIIDKGNPGLRFMDDQEKELFRQEWDKENQKGTFKYFMVLSNDELKDYQKNFTHHSFENPAEHNPEYVAWKKACEIKKVFAEKKEDKREPKENNYSRGIIY